MKKLWLVPVVLLVGFAALVIWFTGICGYRPALANSFATKAYLKYHYDSETIDVQITDAGDVKALKGILTGPISTQISPCGFTDNVTVTLSDGRKSVFFCPALAGCPVFGIGNADRYLQVSEAKRRAFDKICRRYGVIYPN